MKLFASEALSGCLFVITGWLVETRATASARILFYLPPWHSHMINSVNVGLELNRKGYNVTMIVEESVCRRIDGLLKSKSRKDKTLSILKYRGNAIGPLVASHVKNDRSALHILSVIFKCAHDNIVSVMSNETIVGQLKSRHFDLLISDIIDPFRVVLAAELGLKRIDMDTSHGGVSVTTGNYGLRYSTSSVPALGSGLPPGPYFVLDHFKNFIVARLISLMEIPMQYQVNRYLAERGLSGNFMAVSKRDLLLTIVAADWSHYPSRTIAPFEKFVGPLTTEPVRRVPSEFFGATISNASLEVPVGLIVVSAGSSLSFGAKATGTLVRVLEELLNNTKRATYRTVTSSAVPLVGKYQVIWKLSQQERAQMEAGAEAGSSELAALLRRVESTGEFAFKDWIPQNDLLAISRYNGGNRRMHAVVLISHCGSTSMSEALYHGVPILCLPITADQYENAANVRYLGVGDYVHKPQWQVRVVYS